VWFDRMPSHAGCVRPQGGPKGANGLILQNREARFHTNRNRASRDGCFSIQSADLIKGKRISLKNLKVLVVVARF
jgi:hypothetical protein